MLVFHVERSLNPVIIPYRSTEKKWENFGSRFCYYKNRFYGITYNGSYYLNNTDEHKDILKTSS